MALLQNVFLLFLIILLEFAHSLPLVVATVGSIIGGIALMICTLFEHGCIIC